MNNFQPFTYHLYHQITNTHYYGARYCKNANPSDLWTTYFSSSKIVKQMIKDFGKDSFTFEVRKIFKDTYNTLLWEHTVLRRLGVTKRTDWLNRTDNHTKFKCPDKHSDKSKSLMSQKLKGRIFTDEHKQNKSIATTQQWIRQRANGYKRPQSATDASNLWRENNYDSFYSKERNDKMAKSKTGKKRKYLEDGSYIMVDPNQLQ